MSYSMRFVVVDAEAGSIVPERLLGGSVALRCGVTVTLMLKDLPKDNQSVLVEVQLLSAALRMGDQLVGYSHVGNAAGYSLSDRTPYRAPLSAVFSVDGRTLNALELARAGKAAEFAVDAQVAVREPEAGVTTWAFQALRYRVASSDWVETLGNLGLFRTLVVEVPLSAKTDLSSHAHISNELNRAERLSRSGDFSGCVAVLRDVWDPIVKELDTSGRWDAILKRALPTEVGALVDAYAKALRSLVNKGHHREVADENGLSLYSFTAHDAEFLYQASVGFLRYLGLLAR